MLGETRAEAASRRALIETLPIGDMPHAELLGRVRDRLCADALAMGLTLVVSDNWCELEAINRRNLASWVPILHRAASLPSFWVGAVDTAGDGDVVAVQAGLLVDCRAHSFADHLAALELFYDDPADAPAGERCFVGDGPAHETFGPVCWIAAGWNRSDWRGRGLFHLVGRAVRLLSWARWQPSWWCGVVTPDVVPAWATKRAGPRHLDRRPTILYRQAGVERPPLHFLRLGRGGVQQDFGRLVHGRPHQ
ncbi:hypothetical protein [Azospirillum sp.]|uniref:hypothetical protein n=1 Tax=Azospirillum sp. TaxID=34012 RepID=UPI002D566487|nr:hypothetical protein [Azospirillum sp.]HYD68492.1 hypothetical protein [Azospirillum sp.]